MVLDPAAEDREVISPELVLISSPEEAQRAREQLPEVPGFAVRVPRAAAPAAPPLETTPPAIERPPPPPYPRIPINELLPDRAPRRKRGLVVLAACVVAVALATAGYLAETRWHDGSAAPAEAAPPAPTTTATGSASVPTAIPHTPPLKPAVHPAATVAQPAATSPRPPAKHAAPHATIVPAAKAAPAKKVVRANKPQPAGKTVPAKKTVPPTKTVPTKKAVRSAKPLAKPPSPSGFVPARTWAWVPSQGGGGYEVTFFLDGRSVLHAWPKAPRLALPKGFRYHAGHYRWTVRALHPGATGKLIVDGNFVLTPTAAAAANT